MTTPILDPAAAWRMCCDPHSHGVIHSTHWAAAFLYAASQDWIPLGDLRAGGSPVDAKDSRANEKLRARSFFIDLVHSDPTEEDDMALIIRAIVAAPDRWLTMEVVQSFIMNHLRPDADPTSYRELFDRAFRADAVE